MRGLRIALLLRCLGLGVAGRRSADPCELGLETLEGGVALGLVAFGFEGVVAHDPPLPAAVVEADFALERMMAKLSTRRYSAGLELVGAEVEASARSTSKSAVSRRFVARTEISLAELMAADLTSLDIVALVDGVHFAGHLCVVALGIGIDGTKHPLGVVEGDTENATVVKDLLVDLRDRGLDVTRPVLVVIDGARALASAVNAVFDHPVIQRCQLHKIRERRSEALEVDGVDGGQEDARRVSRQP